MDIRSVIASVAAGAAVAVLSTSAVAAPDADAAAKLAKDSGCLKCHTVDKSKKGPSYQKVAAKWKGKADAEQKLIDNITKAPMVKFEDGTQEEHKVVETKDPKAILNLVQWILAQ
jgi:cytochrome c